MYSFRCRLQADSYCTEFVQQANLMTYHVLSILAYFCIIVNITVHLHRHAKRFFYARFTIPSVLREPLQIHDMINTSGGSPLSILKPKPRSAFVDQLLLQQCLIGVCKVCQAGI